ncbi:hypothetical protein SynSYN20_02495 [Synechococcus sp. SYN20]|nr:hypothetical protein SynSYN20_02495 [Synechococcus sp. SYN20]
MNITKTLTPKNENGSLDQRFISYVQSLIEHCGQECIDTLHQFHKETEESERKAGGAALHMIVKLYSLKMEDWEKKRLAKSLREALQEIGFKPSKVTKLMGAGKFKADQWNRLHHCIGYKSDQQLKEEQHDFLNKYGVAALYEISRMNDVGQAKVRNAYVDNGNIMSKHALEEIRQEIPAIVDERRGRRQSSIQGSTKPLSQEADTSINLNAYESLKSAEDNSEPLQLSAQKSVSEFLYSVEPDYLDKLLNQYTPHAQDQILSMLSEAVTKLASYLATRQFVNI